MPNLLIAPTAFKGTFSPLTVANAMLQGARDSRRALSCRIVPLADGGDGTIETLNHVLGGALHPVDVTGPIAKRVSAPWLKLGDTGVVELAGACGIAHLQGHLEPMRAHTYGLGELMRHCIHSGVHKVFVAVGGSASTDGGMGALQALRAEFHGESGEPIIERGGAALNRVAYANVTGCERLVKDVQVTIVTDVTNPLLGPQGAARIFAPQKGASAEEVELLEHGLERFADVMEATTRRHWRDLKGAGAAGGTAYGLAVALDSKIVPGFEWLANLLKLDEHLEWADMVISGEGRFDDQSLQGKVLGSLIDRCQHWEKPLTVVTGSIDESVAVPYGVQVVCVESDRASEYDIARAVEASLTTQVAG